MPSKYTKSRGRCHGWGRDHMDRQSVMALTFPSAFLRLLDDFAKASHSTGNPVGLGVGRRQIHRQHEVRGVPRGGQRASPAQRLVHRAGVHSSGPDSVDFGLQPHYWEVCEQLLGPRLRDDTGLGVPPRPLHEQPVHQHPIFLGCALLHRGAHDLEGEGHGVNADLVLPGVVLEGAREKGLREVQPGDPEHRRGAPVEPLLDKPTSPHQVVHPRAQRPQRGVRLVRPQRGHLVDEHAVAHVFEVLRHHHLPADRHGEVLQRGVHDLQQAVEPHRLLHQHRVEALLVLRRVLRRKLLHREHLGDLSSNLCGHCGQHLLPADPLARPATRLHRQHVPHQLRGLVTGARNVRVGVQPKHLGMGVERPGGDVGEVVRAVSRGHGVVQP
eukprot:RCo029349